MKSLSLAILFAVLPVGAVSWYYWGTSVITLSSEAKPLAPNFNVPPTSKPVKQHPSQPAARASDLAMVPAEKSLFIADCNCSLPSSEPRAINYEDEKTCSPDRNYFS